MENKTYLKFFLISLAVGVILISLIAFTSAADFQGKVKQGDCKTIMQSCGSCSYVNLSAVYKNETILENVGMSSIGGGGWTYDFCNTSERIGDVYFSGEGDLEGRQTTFKGIYITIKNSNEFILYTLIGLAILFFISTLFTSEPFFVYISGVLFIVSGIYLMINGIDIVNDWYSRAISYVLLGIGFLFTVGAYFYNKNNNEDDYDDD